MNIFRNLDSNTSNGSDKVKDLLSYSPLSDSSSIINTGGGSDEEIIQLASNRPKRRAGRMKFRETRHPIYRGVRQRNGDKWVSEVREPNKKSRIWLGTFPTPEMAARAHDVASIALRGRSACLNFADSIWKVPLPESLDAKDIRKAAGEAARALHQSEELIKVRREESNSPAVPEKVFYMDDDEADFGMPRILADMADGLLLSPPHPRDFSWDDVETNADVVLWSYSI